MTKGLHSPSDEEIVDTPTRASSPADSDKCSFMTDRRCWPTLPVWAHQQHRDKWGERLVIHEWEGQNESGNPTDVEQYREENGWKGSDLVHSISSPVRILEYRVQYPSTSPNMGVDTTLTAVVYFTEKAESHRGYCHGGSMCSVMDDIIGWTAFCVTGRCLAWTGYTVQVNTSLMKPIRVGQILKLCCTIEKVERRKVFLKAKLVAPDTSTDEDQNNDQDIVHATGEGLVILNRGVLDGH